MSRDRIVATTTDWRITSDDVQWILQCKHANGWRPVSFVHSQRDILARILREHGADPQQAALLLSGLPDTFDQWNALHTAPGEA